MNNCVRASISTSFVAAVALVALAALAPAASAADTAPPSPSPTSAPLPSAARTKSCGEGACRRAVPAALECKPGLPITTNDGWLTKPDPATGSWDANCDGRIEKKPVPDLTGYVWNCRMERGICRSDTKADFACGEETVLWDRCELARATDGTTTCRVNVLKGKIVQSCR